MKSKNNLLEQLKNLPHFSKNTVRQLGKELGLDGLASYANGIEAETLRNVLKEELQFYVLNFIYNRPEYNTWIMYGGSALRIIHGLDRMSIYLDFEISHAITEEFLGKLKKNIEEHFISTYGVGADFLSIKITSGRGLLLKFHVGEELSSGNPSKQVHVKIEATNKPRPALFRYCHI